MTDHLGQARESATRSSGQSDPMVAVAHLCYSIERLADAIEELQPTINPELTVQPETVPVLLPEHRDRVWRDNGGYTWRPAVDHEERLWWVDSPMVPSRLATSHASFGPFTAVEVP